MSHLSLTYSEILKDVKALDFSKPTQSNVSTKLRKAEQSRHADIHATNINDSIRISTFKILLKLADIKPCSKKALAVKVEP